MTNPREEFEKLSSDKKLEILWPRIQIMIGLLKDTKLNYDKFLIPKGSMNKDSIVYKEFCEKYYTLFPGEKNEEKSIVAEND